MALETYWQPGVRGMLFLGFFAGLPLLLVYGTLSYWLREAGIERGTIGFLSWVALAYGFKWVWSPLVDRLKLPWLTEWLGQRRAWMLVAQLGVILGLCGLAFSDPLVDLLPFTLFALMVAFSSATQDISIDAYRIELAETAKHGPLAANYMFGYRIAMIVSGGGVLALAEWASVTGGGYQPGAWSIAYLCMAALMVFGPVTVLIIERPQNKPDSVAIEKEAMVDRIIESQIWLPVWLRRFAEWFYGAVISPFVEFIRRFRWHAVLVLALIASYRISDVVLGVIANVFYVDMGFTKGEVGLFSGFMGVIMTLLGTVVFGMLAIRFSIMKLLFLGGLLAAITNLLFVWMAGAGHDLFILAIVICADNLSGGFAVAAFVAYLSSLTNVTYSATQYALFSSVMLLLPKLVGGFSGVMVDSIGYVGFFLFTTLLGVPVLLLILLAMRYLPVREAV